MASRALSTFRACRPGTRPGPAGDRDLRRARRRRGRDRLRRRFDAASRGPSVALREKRDFAAGTSSRSSKLIHGGLRYLESFDFELVREALHERRLLVEKVAPHWLIRPRSCSRSSSRVWERFYMGVGLVLYDALAGVHPGDAASPSSDAPLRACGRCRLFSPTR